jgi:hypothetical protein
METKYAMETYDDKIHIDLDTKKLILLGEVPNKTWIQLPPELSNKKCNVLETIEIICLCELHLTSLYILDGSYWTFNCPHKGWCWIEASDVAKVKRLKRI